MAFSPRQLLSPGRPHRRASEFWLLVSFAVGLELAAGTGLAYIAEFGEVRAVLGHFHPGWILELCAALLISLVGYYSAYRGVIRIGGGPSLSARQIVAVMAAGFGGFLAHSGPALDKYALRAAGATQSEAKVRVLGLAGLEQGMLAIGGCACAIALLVSGHKHQPPLSATLPWAVVPVPGFLFAFWVANRYRDRFTATRGWRATIGAFLRAVQLLRELFTRPRWGPAVAGMALFWAAEGFAAWAGLNAFGFRMNPAALFVGLATGMVFTRRTGPLGGAGVLTLVLPLTIWYCGAPLPVAIVGVFAYRVLALLLAMPFALAVLPTLRALAAKAPARPARAAEPAPPPPGRGA
jgi:hypothetical protein